MESVDGQAKEVLTGVSGTGGPANETGRQRQPISPRTGSGPHLSLHLETQVGAKTLPQADQSRTRLARSPNRRVGSQNCASGGHHWRAVVGSGFFRECLAKDRGESAEESKGWRESIYAEIRSRMRAQGGLSIQRMC